MRSFWEQYKVTPLRASSNPKNKKVISKGRKKIIMIKNNLIKIIQNFTKKSYRKNYGKK